MENKNRKTILGLGKELKVKYFVNHELMEKWLNDTGSEFVIIDIKVVGEYQNDFIVIYKK